MAPKGRRLPVASTDCVRMCYFYSEDKACLRGFVTCAPHPTSDASSLHPIVLLEILGLPGVKYASDCILRRIAYVL